MTAKEQAAITLLRDLADAIEQGKVSVFDISFHVQESGDPYCPASTRLEVSVIEPKKSDC